MLGKSNIFSELKGKEGGLIFQGYRGAIMIRTLTTGGGRDSARWQETRANLATASSQWKTLTVLQQDAWNAAVSSFPYIDKFGNPQDPSGFQLFVTLNFFNLRFGNPLLTTPPSPSVKINYGPITIVATSTIDIELTWAGATAVGVGLNIFAAPPLSKGVTDEPTRFRFIRSVGTAAAQPIQISQDIEAAWGILPPSGRFWITTEAIDLTSFEHYNPFTEFDDL